MIRTLCATLLLLSAGIGAVEAQTPSVVFCQPIGRSPAPFPCPAAITTHTGGTISVTNTFQVALALNNTPNAAGGIGTRQGCLLQSNATSTHTLYVHFKPSGGAAATLVTSFALAPGDTISCANSANQILQEEIDVTGTSGDTYSLSYQ